MTSKYYYLAASLPYLSLGPEPPVDTKDFLGQCSRWLSAKELEILQKVSLNDFRPGQDDIPVLRAWKEFDLNFRAEIALARKEKDARGGKQGALAKRVMEQPHPLLMEQEASRIRWETLDGLEAGNFFNLDFLAVYFLKLQIMERLKLFDRMDGERIFNGLCEVRHEWT